MRSQGRPDRFKGKQVGDRNWQKDHACEDMDASIFYPTDKAVGVLEAKRICAQCPVKEDCLEHALKYREDFGVWGGTTEGDRVAIRRARRKNVA